MGATGTPRQSVGFPGANSGCDKNCQKLIQLWLSTTTQRIESSGCGYAMYSEWSISYPDETDTDVNNPLIVLISCATVHIYVKA